MSLIADWRGREIQVARSSGGVLAVADPWDNVISTGVRPWPPPELVQKLYKSRQVRAFVETNHTAVTARLGFYSDLQSIHSEDAITWSVVGPIVYAAPTVREAFVRGLFALLGIPYEKGTANLWLWRRLPHPDTLVPGGPEVDFGIQTDHVFLLGEAKWRSSVGAAQGVHRDKDQLTLRREFCEKYGQRMLPRCSRFVVLGVSWNGRIVTPADTVADGIILYARDTTWHAIVNLPSHPCAEELRAYLDWKIKNSMAG